MEDETQNSSANMPRSYIKQRYPFRQYWSRLLTILILCGCVSLLVTACDVAPTGNIPVAKPTQKALASSPTTLAQVTSTTAPTPTPNNVAAYLGSDVSAFQALYGPRGDSSLKGSIIWTLSKTQWFDINFDPAQQHVYDLSHYFYPASQLDNHQQDNVSFEVAHQTCSRFMPPDSVQVSINKTKPDPGLADGVQYIFKSKWLANQLDASWFYFNEGTGTMSDKYNTPVDSGTYTVFYIGGEQSGYEMCFLTAGINWPY